MKVKTTSRAAWEKACAERGIKQAAPDHPVYSEGPSIVFISRSPETSRRGIDEHKPVTEKHPFLGEDDKE